ncbi:MAG: box helicase domain protein, partial [Frankiales bacterium]|nr:box helicase domain protein [Frankiales bacterium]
ERRMLEQIERLTGTKVPLLPVPTVADLAARRLAATKTALLEVLQGGDVNRVRGILGELEQEYDVKQIALAAIELLHSQKAPADETDIPVVKPYERPVRDDYLPNKPFAGGKGPTPRERKGPRAGWAKIYIGVGRGGNVRPQDLVGAIAGESHLTGKQIGSIEITERFSLVEIPEGDIDQVIKALRSSVIKGRKAIIRRDRDA